MHGLRRALVVGSVAFAFATQPMATAAQQLRMITLGDRTRILALHDPSWRVGTVTSVTADTLWLRDANAGVQTSDAIATSTIRAIEQWQHGGGTIRVLGFGVLGLAVGGLTGGVLGFAASGGFNSTKHDWSGFGAILGMPLGAIVGAVTGGIVGRATGGCWNAAVLPGQPGRSQ